MHIIFGCIDWLSLVISHFFHSLHYLQVLLLHYLTRIVLQVVSECNKAEDWYKDKKQQQDALPKSANPALLAADIKKKTEFLDRYMILNLRCTYSCGSMTS